MTITLDDDVVARIERLSQERKTTINEIVNTVLREGLDIDDPVEPTRRFTSACAPMAVSHHEAAR
jgi:hypothetical protein